MSTIDLTLQQKPNLDLAASASSSWSGDTWNAALSSAMAAFHVVGAAVIWILAYSPFWLLVCGIGWWGFRARRQGRATTV